MANRQAARVSLFLSASIVSAQERFDSGQDHPEPSEDAGRPGEVHRPKLDDGRKRGLQPTPAFHHRAEILGAHFGGHGTLGQGHKANRQRACVPVAVLADATAKKVFEAFEGEVGVVDKDDEMVVEFSGGAAWVDVVVGRHVLLVADDVHVGGREGVLSPVNITGLRLAAQGAVSGLDGVVRDGDFEAIHVSDFLAISE